MSGITQPYTIISTLTGVPTLPSEVTTAPPASTSAFLSEYSSIEMITSIVQDPRLWACVSVYGITRSCALATSGFQDLAPSDKASCECYLPGGNTYAPNVYDGYFSTCLDLYSTYQPNVYSSSLYGDQVPHNPCAVVGNIRNGPTASGAAASATLESGTGTPTLTVTSGVAGSTVPTATATATAPATFTGSANARPPFSKWLVALNVVVIPFFLRMHV